MEQHFSFWDILTLALYLGSITFLFGLTYQCIIIIKTDHKVNFRQFILIALTRFLTISLSLLIWIYWTMQIDIQFGFLFLPAFISEVLLSPLLLKFFGYSIWITKKAST
jgi:hypothetical protein